MDDKNIARGVFFVLRTLFLGIAAGLLPSLAAGQQWEIQGGWSMVDYDGPEYVLYSNEHLPAGGRIQVRTHLLGGLFFLEGGVMYGREKTPSAESWMRSWMVSAGHAFRGYSGDWHFGFRPSLGVGSVRWSYVATANRDKDVRGIYSAEMEVEFGRARPFGLPAVVALTAGLGKVGPLRSGLCSGCSTVLRDDALPRRSIGLLVIPGGR